MVRLYLPGQRPLAVQAQPVLHVEKDGAVGVQAGSCLTERERRQVGQAAESVGVELLEEAYPCALDQITEELVEVAEALRNPSLQSNAAR
jgi:hypothetical protein